jgi:hypothetical protein
MIGLFLHIYKPLRYLRYDPFADFIPVTLVCNFPYLISVGPVVPDQVKTITDFFAWCRANPLLATYGTGGVGTPMHFTGCRHPWDAAGLIPSVLQERAGHVVAVAHSKLVRMGGAHAIAAIIINAPGKNAGSSPEP